MRQRSGVRYAAGAFADLVPVSSCDIGLCRRTGCATSRPPDLYRSDRNAGSYRDSGTSGHTDRDPEPCGTYTRTIPDGDCEFYADRHSYAHTCTRGHSYTGPNSHTYTGAVAYSSIDRDANPDSNRAARTDATSDSVTHNGTCSHADLYNTSSSNADAQSFSNCNSDVCPFSHTDTYAGHHPRHRRSPGLPGL